MRREEPSRLSAGRRLSRAGGDENRPSCASSRTQRTRVAPRFRFPRATRIWRETTSHLLSADCRGVGTVRWDRRRALTGHVVFLAKPGCGELSRPETCSSAEALFLQPTIGGARGHGGLLKPPRGHTYEPPACHGRVRSGARAP